MLRSEGATVAHKQARFLCTVCNHTRASKGPGRQLEIRCPWCPALLAGPSRCLDAFTTALIECGDGTQWYTSTTQLQLASYDLCVACRAVPTLHLTVDGGMPARLKKTSPAGSRLPPLRPRGITWNLPTFALNGGDPVFSDVRVLILGHGLGLVGKGFKRWVDGFSLPPMLEQLEFSQFYDRPIHKMSWSEPLREITFGEAFNQPIHRVRWPESLEKLTFGEGFNQPVEKVKWPASLKEIAFGMNFNQPITTVAWPVSLRNLSFGDHFDQSVAGVVWPRTLQELAFSRAFRRQIDDIDWPVSLEVLTIAVPPDAPLPTWPWPGVEVRRVWRYWWKT